MSFRQPLPDGLTVPPDGVGDANNPAADDQELQQGRWWGRWTVAANLPNAASNAATGAAFNAMRPGDEAFVEAGPSMFTLSDRGKDEGADAVWFAQEAAGVIERWCPAETSSNDAEFRVRNIAGTGTFRFNFPVPLDFAALTSVELVGWPSAGAGGTGKDIDLASSYGAIGQDRATHTETDTTTTYNTGTQDVIFALDLSPVFSAIAAGDFCGVQVDHNSVGGSIMYIGIRLRYTR